LSSVKIIFVAVAAMYEKIKMKEWLYRIGLTFIPGIGDVLAKNLVAYCGSPEAVFREKRSKLQKIPGIGKVLSEMVADANVLKKAEAELKFVEENKITPLFYTDAAYPSRLKNCSDSPVVIYYKGTAGLNASKVLSIVGTRNISRYGKKVCEALISDLASHDVLVVSGLAYGVDICAHRACVDLDVPTIGVLAHGLDRVYPSMHRSTADAMLANGGLLTDFPQGTNPDKENFPKRNRIVAGMADATVVIESGIKGGSLITADIANSYNRDVFAFPGRVDDQWSEGCNKLIKANKAALVESAEDILFLMGWLELKKKEKKPVQKEILLNLSPDEEALINVLKEKDTAHIDDLCYSAGFSMSKVSALLLSLEFSGVVRSMPGKMYQLN
jgi:DNA processing protein